MRGNAEYLGLQRCLPSECVNFRPGFEVGFLNEILGILDTGGHAPEEGFQLSLECLEFTRKWIRRHFCFLPAFNSSIISVIRAERVSGRLALSIHLI